MNPFERFGLRQLSPSSLNLWTAAPGLWALRYLAGVRDDGNAAMWRGRAIEKGLGAWLLRPDKKSALDAALAAFEDDAAGLADEDTEDEHNLIEPMLEIAIISCAALPSKLLTTQAKVEFWMCGIPIPVVGYLDFVFEDESFLELKSTKQCPSNPRPEHVRQVALYRKARKSPGTILYVTGKRAATFPIGDNETEVHVGELRQAALSLQRFLSRCEQPSDAILSLPMNASDFRWSEAASNKLAELQRS